jgi:hypothetical protein
MYSADEAPLPAQFSAVYGGVSVAAMATVSNAAGPAAASSVRVAPALQSTERGYLLTAYDTPRGVRYVIIESDRDFSPVAKLTDVEKDFSALVSALERLQSRSVVYVTDYPLIAANGRAAPRILREAEINGLKSALQGRAANINFVNWQ